MARIAIVGGGVLGLLAAFWALRQGDTVDLVDPGDDGAISWNGARIVRDPRIGAGDNTRPWSAVLKLLGHGAVDARPVVHLEDAHQVAEPLAFCLDTARVRVLLHARLGAEPHFTWHRTKVMRIEAEGRALRLADGQLMRPDAAIVAAGQGSADLAGDPGAIQMRWQVCAELPRVPPAVRAPFVQHKAGHGLWGTPAVGAQPAKISASDLCFDSRAEAEAFVASPVGRGAFLVRARQLPEAVAVCPDSITEGDVCWRIDSYAASRAPRIRQIGRTTLHLACDGGLFKRAPMVAEALLETLKPGVMM
jgi:hypothetical protein